MELREYFGKAEDFVGKHYPISKNGEFARNPEAIIRGNLAPTILDANIMYGGVVMEEWFRSQLMFLSEFCGCKDKITPLQLVQLAENLNAEFYYLKITEFMWFFNLVSRAKFGELGYGAFSPIRLQEMVWEFIRYYRNPTIEKVRSDDLDEMLRKAKENAVPCPEHIKPKWEKVFNKFSNG